MAPKVAKARSRSPKRDVEKVEKVAEEPKKEEEPKFQEADAPQDSKPSLKEKIHFETASTTLNVVPTLGGKLLTSLTEGGMSCFLAGAQANVAQKAGRYMFEAKIVESSEQQGGGKQAMKCLKIGFSTSSSSLLMGDEESVCFDNDGFFHAGKKKQVVKGLKIGSQQVVALVLNLDSKSPNFNTVAIYRDGAAVGEPMALPEELKGKALFPHVIYRNVSITTNFGPNALKELPFKCRLLQAAAAADCSVAASQEPKDGKFEVMMPVGFPDEGTFDWLDSYLEKNPQFVELSDRKIAQWAKASGIWGKGSSQSNDKPNINFGLPGQDANSLRRVINAVAPIVPRNYLVMEVKSNLVAAERKEVLKKFNYPCYKKVAHVVMGEPSKEHKSTVQNKLLKEKQGKADILFRAKLTEATRKKAAEKRAKELAKTRKETEKKKQDVLHEKKVKEAEAKGEPAPEKKDEPMEEAAEEEKEEEPMETEPPKVELTDLEKKVFYLPTSTPDLTQQVLNASFAKFTTPAADEGFDDIRYEWQKGDKAAAYLKKWVMETKLATRIDNIKPGESFKEKKVEFEKLEKSWHENTKKGAKKADGADDVDIPSVADVADAGNGVPLFQHFDFEDWMLLKLRFEFAMLVQSFKADSGDADRTGIPVDHVPFYLSKYFSKAVNAKNYGMADLKEVLTLIKDTVAIEDGLLVSKLAEDVDGLDIFVKLTEEQRRERCRRIEAGDETARLKFVAPAKPAAKPEAKPDIHKKAVALSKEVAAKAGK